MPSRIVCFVCGSLGGEYQLHSRPCEGYPFFPFLEHHDPPKGSRVPGPDGLVDSCRVCYAFLTQQWETYERTNTPAIKRLYWLKRVDDGQFTGAEMKLQGEYMAQVMGLQYQPSCGDGCAPLSPDSRDGSAAGGDSDFRSVRKPPHQDDGDRVLDLSVSVKSETSSKSTSKMYQTGDKFQREASNSRTNFDEFSFVCYTCGSESEGIAAKFISSMPHMASEPFFPFLSKLTPPKGAAPMSSQGVCQVCDRCFSSLCHQWLSYEHHGTPNSARIFKVNSLFFSNDSSIAIGPGTDTLSSTGEVCYLCGKSWSSSKICSLYTAPVSGRSDQMYFPFIRELRRPHGARPLNPDGSVQVCISCLSNLQAQWQRYEAEKVPFLQRRYSLLPPSSSTVNAVSHTPSMEQDVKNEMLKTESLSKGMMQPVVTEIRKSPALAKTHAQEPQSHPSGASLSSNSTTAQETGRHSGVDTKSHAGAVLSIPHPLQQASERPKKVCFLCGEKCLLSKAQVLYSYPVRHEAKSAGGQSQTIPFFPFLANHPPALNSEPMTEEGTVSACSYCYYSLLNQWRDYEESKGITDRNRWLRKYTLNEYVCFVCGKMVPRKKMRTLEVQKFQFLREHKAPPNALVMWGGECVGACGSCHFSLTHQFTEYERLGLPVELRKYNWTVQHHAEENSCDANDSSQDVPSVAVNEDSNLSVTEDAEDSSQGPRAPFTLMSPAAVSGKFPKPTTASPLRLMSPSNGLTATSTSPGSLNATHTSSFAAALRNLAHSAKDPQDDLKHSISPAASQTSRPNSPNRTHSSLVFSSHSVSSPFMTPLTVSIASSYPEHGLASMDARETIGRIPTSHPTSTHERWSKPDHERQTPSSEARDDSGLSGRDPLPHLRTPTVVPPQRPLTSGSLPISTQAMNLYARGFHAYRPDEEEAARHGLPLPYGIDPAAYAAAAYHPALFQQQAAFTQGSLRLGDSLLLEQYRMMQSPYLPFSTAALMSPHAVGLGVHSMLAAAATSPHHPPGLLQHYPYFTHSQPMLDPQVVVSSAMLERSQLEAEKARDRRMKDKKSERHQSLDMEIDHKDHAMVTVEERKLEPGQKEHHRNSDSAGRETSEHRDVLTVPNCLSLHTGESSSKHHYRHEGDHRSGSGRNSSGSSGQRHNSKFSPSLHDPVKASTSPEKAASIGLHLNTHPNDMKSRDTTASGKNQTSKNHEEGSSHNPLNFSPMGSLPHPLHMYSPHDRDSGQQAPPSSSLSVPELHFSQGSPQLPSSVSHSFRVSSSTTGPAAEKNKSSSEFRSLFRPFDDSKPKCDAESSHSPSHQSYRHSHREWQQHHSVPLSAFHYQESPVHGYRAEGSGQDSSHFSPSQGPSVKRIKTTIADSLSSAPSSLNHRKLRQSSNCLNDRIERFDFKSLARECTSSATLNDSNVNDLDVDSSVQTQVLSKLDVEAARAKERRQRGEETDSDTEITEEERKHVRLTMVGRTTPIPLDSPPEKLKLLEYLGLTTWTRKRELIGKREMRRRRQMRMASLSPIQHEVDILQGLDRDSLSAWNRNQHNYLSYPGSAHPDMHHCDMNPSQKSEFLTRLGLMPLTLQEKAELEKSRKYLAEVNLTRNIPMNSQGHDGRSGVKRKHKECEASLSGLQKTHFYAGIRTHHQYLDLPDHQHYSESSNTFSNVGQASTFSLPSTSNSPFNASSHQSYSWPGIEAVLDSYRRHKEDVTEQLAETQILHERCQQLQAENQQIEEVNHRVSRQMAFLLEESQRMEEERAWYQEAISSLKDKMHSFR